MEWRGNWYKKLYIGDTAKKRTRKIIRKIRQGVPQRNVYLITLASNPENQLDIFHSDMLLDDALKFLNPTVVGIALGYQEAVELVGKIAGETYRTQGNANIREYLENQTTNSEQVID